MEYFIISKTVSKWFITKEVRLEDGIVQILATWIKTLCSNCRAWIKALRVFCLWLSKKPKSDLVKSVLFGIQKFRFSIQCVPLYSLYKIYSHLWLFINIEFVASSRVIAIFYNEEPLTSVRANKWKSIILWFRLQSPRRHSRICFATGRVSKQEDRPCILSEHRCFYCRETFL